MVVLTTSEAEEDILRSYDLHANAYVTKPVDFERFIEMVRQIDDFFVRWSSSHAVPEAPAPASSQRRVFVRTRDSLTFRLAGVRTRA